MIEVEFKFRISDVSAFEEKLKRLGAESKGRWREDDIYFSPSHRDFWKTVECLRIRKFSDGKSGAILTYEPPSLDEASGKGCSFAKTKSEVEVKKRSLLALIAKLGISEKDFVSLPYRHMMLELERR
ncbi:MAG: CYTH domain-containing protein [Candidatus Aenigmatarchaeota archaeon]